MAHILVSIVYVRPFVCCFLCLSPAGQLDNSGSEGSSDVLMLANGPKLIFLERDQLPMRWKKRVLLAGTLYTGMHIGESRLFTWAAEAETTNPVAAVLRVSKHLNRHVQYCAQD